jgi:hypothetical protein
MLIVVQPELAEHAVFAAVRRDAFVEQAYHREFARCHQHASADERDAAFRYLHETWFAELGFLGRVDRLTRLFPRLRDRVERLVMREAHGRGNQSVDLFGAPGRYTIGMSTSVGLLLDEAAFTYFARHELLHIDDMLDPVFEYDPGALAAAGNRAHQNLVRDRFAVAWAMSCDARLESDLGLPEEVRGRRQAEFSRVFASGGTAARGPGFDDLWAEWKSRRPRHPDLLALAMAGCTSHSEGSNGHHPAPARGGRCPACGFATFDWADEGALGAVRAAVRQALPEWRPGWGLCRRCAEVFAARAAASAPLCCTDEGGACRP